MTCKFCKLNLNSFMEQQWGFCRGCYRWGYWAEISRILINLGGEETLMEAK